MHVHVQAKAQLIQCHMQICVHLDIQYGLLFIYLYTFTCTCHNDFFSDSSVDFSMLWRRMLVLKKSLMKVHVLTPAVHVHVHVVVSIYMFT